MIAAVQDGVIAEIGTHDDLMEKKGVYYQLVMLQTLAEQVEEEEKDNLSLLSQEDRGKKFFHLVIILLRYSSLFGAYLCYFSQSLL